MFDFGRNDLLSYFDKNKTHSFVTQSCDSDNGRDKFLMLGSVSLLTNPYVVSFIYDVLGKSYTWVGRLHIYAMIFDVIKVHPWIGYGYFSNIVEEILGFEMHRMVC